MTPFHFVSKYESFGGICCFNLQVKVDIDSFKDREAQKLCLPSFSFGILPCHNFLH